MGIGNRIKAARLDAKLTQKELAERAGVAVITIQQYEGNKRQPRIEQLQRIAAALGVPLLDLAGVSVSPGVNAAAVIDELSSRGYSVDTPQRLAEALEDRLFDESIPELNEAFEKLNEKGRRVAIERVKELAKIPEYQQAEAPSVRAEFP